MVFSHLVRTLNQSEHHVIGQTAADVVGEDIDSDDDPVVEDDLVLEADYHINHTPLQYRGVPSPSSDFHPDLGVSSSTNGASSQHAHIQAIHERQVQFIASHAFLVINLHSLLPIDHDDDDTSDASTTSVMSDHVAAVATGIWKSELLYWDDDDVAAVVDGFYALDELAVLDARGIVSGILETFLCGWLRELVDDGLAHLLMVN
ncbi:hypothetical protein F0562_029595 [Nyssa sinensis]|uniref:Uncharacterized protein n=1 Tax=Nyssa sinensis TaxID=561372 RepID=A0A5J5B5P9_9ASTE|nr:hypothetical protein F0562_029595 [Nyssa sinensis]